ncbi:MAG: peptidoglycan-binding protein [Clostridia bacterium]|nr:peptidoglycan-binding protein [Clostridia bacterium]
MAHTGLYVGDSRAVHCSGEVKEDPLSAGRWTHYAVPKGLYTEAELAAGNARRLPPTLRRGDRGESVARLQRLLLAQGYDLGHAGADGIFGAATMAAVQAFQRASGLQADGVADADTQAVLAAASQADGDLSALRAALAGCLSALDRIIGAQHG